LKGRGENDFEKKEETIGRNRKVWEGMSLESYFFFITQNPPNLVELKNCIGWRFGGGLEVYMNSSNLINVV
jgi:hypothetical protein